MSMMDSFLKGRESKGWGEVFKFHQFPVGNLNATQTHSTHFKDGNKDFLAGSPSQDDFEGKKLFVRGLTRLIQSLLAFGEATL